MGSLYAYPEDIARWRREGRDDILRYVEIVGEFGDLWIKNGEESERCPFVRKIPGTKKYHCRIYDTRPQICRDYVPWAEGSICEDV
jgi:Fe-S-cluster containining protein